MSLTRWLGLGLVSAAAIAAIVIGLTGTRDEETPATVTVSAATTRPDGGVAFSLPDNTTSGQTVTDVPTDADTPAGASSSVGETDPEPAQTTSSTPSGTGTTAVPAAVPASNVSAEVRLRIPALGVDARVSPLGFDGAGGFAVPTTAYGVGWYEFSAYPGAPGNAVFAGHLNWSGSRGVFDRLDELSPGDMIYVDTGSGEIAYRVSRSHSVSADTPFVQILGERSGPSTLTLFTCDGTYVRSAGEYDQRLVVDAVRA